MEDEGGDGMVAGSPHADAEWYSLGHTELAPAVAIHAMSEHVAKVCALRSLALSSHADMPSASAIPSGAMSSVRDELSILWAPAVGRVLRHGWNDAHWDRSCCPAAPRVPAGAPPARAHAPLSCCRVICAPLFGPCAVAGVGLSAQRVTVPCDW